MRTSDTGVRVETSSGVTHTADRVIVTLPLGVLKIGRVGERERGGGEGGGVDGEGGPGEASEGGGKGGNETEGDIGGSREKENLFSSSSTSSSFSVTFEPELSQRKLEAVGRLGFGSITKVCVT